MTAALPEHVLGFLGSLGLYAPGTPVAATPLTGGVSSELWRVDLPGRVVCVKGALARLKVDHEWLAPVSRNGTEHDWLRFAARVCPGQVPRVLGFDAAAGLIAMEYLPPEHYPVWKAQLLAGRIDAETAGRVGDLVGRLHAAGVADPDARRRFATDANFDDLRIEPYLRVTARAHPDLRARFAVLAARTAGTRLTVVHGDVSPKNILIGAGGPVLIDAECAWFGDPAFDIAFCLNHLVLKAVLLPDRAADLATAARAFLAAHARHITWEPRATFGERVAALLPALALARVDGASPVEYLDDAGRRTVRGRARSLWDARISTPAEAIQAWCADGAATGRPDERSVR